MREIKFGLIKDALFDLALITVVGEVIAFIAMGWVVRWLFRLIGRRARRDDLADSLRSAGSGNID